MRVAVMILAFIALFASAPAHACSEPSAPYCATRYGAFDDQDDFDRCKRQMSSYQSEAQEYPYFCENPALSNEAARIGLWIMSQCIDKYETKDMRILDVVKGRSFSDLDTPLIGNEEALLIRKYGDLLKEWETLRTEY